MASGCAYRAAVGHRYPVASGSRLSKPTARGSADSRILHLLPGSSEAERRPVKTRVAGSIPALAAIWGNVPRLGELDSKSDWRGSIPRPHARLRDSRSAIASASCEADDGMSAANEPMEGLLSRALSSSGLGHGIVDAGTRVRIPAGPPSRAIIVPHGRWATMTSTNSGTYR
jgi:hypothetical protein